MNMATEQGQQRSANEELMMSPSATVREFEKSIAQHGSHLEQLKTQKAIIDARIEELRLRSVDLSREIDEMGGVIKAETSWRDTILAAIQKQSPGNQGQ